MMMTCARPFFLYRLALLLVLSMLLAPLCHAAESFPFWRASLQNTGWTKRDGAPLAAFSIAQHSNGLLLFAATDGLYQFDGVRFERSDSIDRQKLLSLSLTTIENLAGAIWVGYRSGGVSMFHHGQVRHYTEKDGLPLKSVTHIARAADGTMWLSTISGMFWLDGERWRQAGPDSGLPAGPVLNFFLLSDSSVVVLGAAGLYQSTGASRRFRLALAQSGISLSLKRRDDTILLSGKGGRMQLLTLASGKLQRLPLRSYSEDSDSYFVDGRDGLWLNSPQGMQLFDASFRLFKTFTPEHGFSGKLAVATLMDREGNMWIATEGGVDRIREARLTTVALPPGWHPSVSLLADAGGAMWLGISGGPASAPAPAVRIDRQGARQASGMREVVASYRQPDGTLWFAGNSSLWRRQGEQTRQWALPPELAGQDVQAMTMAPDGVLWLSISGKALYTFNDGAWLEHGGRGDLGGDNPLAMLTDRQGRLWLAYVGNRLLMLDRGKLRQFGPADGLDVGNIFALAADPSQPGRLWLGGDAGLAYFDGGTFHALADADGSAFRSISGVVATARGELWLHGSDGVIRIGTPDLADALQRGTGRVRSEEFGYFDGHKGAMVDLRPVPTLVEATDGRLWYSTMGSPDSVGWVDPAHIARNPVAPDVLVTRLTTDQGGYLPASAAAGAGAGLTLPELTSNLGIDFTATALSIPQQVRFRFRLTGVDADWRDAGTRRHVAYTNLGPGDYVFEVMAANEDGVWSRAPAIAAFRIAPTFFQTAWFRGACVVAALIVLYLLYLLRVAQLTARIGERMQVRLQERQRIARTLHDTFLQSVYGLILRFDIVKEKLPDIDGTHRQIETVLRQAETVLHEGRDQLLELRIVPHANFDQALSELGQGMAAQHGAGFAMHTSGAVRVLLPQVQQELFNIAREALLNAFQHAGASHISLDMAYGGVFELVVRDDGKGIAPDVLAAGGRPGHWGLTGMRERAARIGASIATTSAPGATVIKVSAPARLVYDQALSSSLWRRMRQQS